MNEELTRDEIDKLHLETRMKIDMVYADTMRALEADGRKAKRNLIIKLVVIWSIAFGVILFI